MIHFVVSILHQIIVIYTITPLNVIFERYLNHGVDHSEIISSELDSIFLDRFMSLFLNQSEIVVFT